MASSPEEIETICECQYTLTLSGNAEGARETKDNFDNAPNIHEIDEEDSEPEEDASTSVQSSPDKKDTVRETKDVSENECVYADELSSSDESEITNVTPETLTSDSSSLLRAAEVDEWNNDPWDDESYSRCRSEPTSRAATLPDGLVRRRCRRWNMSFTDDEMRKIEYENEILLRKIMTQQKPRQKIVEERTVQPRVSSSAINRKKLQKKIEDDNMVGEFPSKFYLNARENNRKLQ